MNNYKLDKTQKTKTISKVKIYVDIFLFVLMIVVLIPQSTGIPIHEWAGFIILIPFLFHLVINWNWIANSSTKFLKKEGHKTRFSFVLNWLLYLSMILVTISGIVISESALPVFGIHFEPDQFWSVVHNLSATLLMAILGIHIALHWKWIVGTFRKLKFKSDFHTLSEINVILKKYYRQLLIIIIVSVVFSVLFWGFNYSEWADGFRISSVTQSSEETNTMPQNWLIYILPLLKVTVIITIPALMTGGILKLKQLTNKVMLKKANDRD